MKRRLMVLAAMLLIVSTALFAVDFKAVIGQDTSAALQFSKAGSNSDVRTQFLFSVDAELDMDFKNGHGMLVEVNPFSESGSVEFGLGVGYAYQDWLSSSTSMILGVGPKFTFGNGGVGFEIFATIDFDFHVSSSMFVRVGTGMRFDMGEFGNDNFGKTFDITVPLPHLGIGWEF